MKSKNILEVIKGNNIVIPSYLLKYYKELNLNEKELIFVSYLLGIGNKILFDIEKMSHSLGIKIPEVMEIISSLTNKKLINMIIDNKETGMMREYLDVSLLYDKILVFLIGEQEIEEEVVSDIYSVIEKEFGRTLSPIEYETIKGWLDSKISEDIIKEALKEAILNGVTNLKYIDKILYEWNRKGYKKAQDIKKKKVEKEESINLFDYDWLEDNE